jgi:pyruvate/2-oxoglutarate/acetoin dehydrogenase E1 component
MRDDTRPGRVADNVNRALHTALTEDPRVWLRGEDVHDPVRWAGGRRRGGRGTLSTSS